MNKCVYPRPNKFASAARAKSVCGMTATILTEVPIEDKRQVRLFPMQLCLTHSVYVAIDKLAMSLERPHTLEELEVLQEYGLVKIPAKLRKN